MFKKYCIKLIFRICVFLVGVYAYFASPEILDYVEKYKITDPIYGVYVVWAILMGSMILHMFPNDGLTMGSKKRFRSEYRERAGYDHLALYEYKLRSDRAAIMVLIVWLCFNAIFGLLYLLKIIHAKELIMISLFFYVCDLICVVIWCPFQNFFMKNKCCVNCRIFNWGHFMMFTPLLFIPHFLTWSLFFTGLILMLRWEIVYLQHPERFWENSNEALRCVNCKDKICKIKTAKFLEFINLEAGPRYEGEDLEFYLPKDMSEEDKAMLEEAKEGLPAAMQKKLENIYIEIAHKLRNKK